MRCLWPESFNRSIWSDAMRCIWFDHRLRCCFLGTNKISRLTNRSIWSDAMQMVRCDAVHLVRRGASLYKQDQSVDKPKHMVRCDAVHMVRCGSCLYQKDQFDYKSVRGSDAMRCILSDAMRCIWSDVALVCTKSSVRLQIGAYGPMRCGAYGPMRCGAYGPMLCFFVQTRSVGLQAEAYGSMLFFHLRLGAQNSHVGS